MNRGRLAFKLFDSFFHLLARLEGDHVFFGHEHFVAGSGVARLAGGTPLHFKHAKISQLNPPLCHQRLDNRVEGLLHDLLRLELRQTDFL